MFFLFKVTLKISQGLPVGHKLHNCLCIISMTLSFHHSWLRVFFWPAASGPVFLASLFWLPASFPGKMLALGMLCFRIGKLLHLVQEDQLVLKYSFLHETSCLQSSCSLSEDRIQDIVSDEQINQMPSIANLEDPI